MNNTQSIYRNLVSFGIPLLLLLAILLLAKNNLLNVDSKSLSLGITLDLLITIPFIFYMLIRKTNVSKTFVIPLVVLGLMTGFFILPEKNQIYLSLYKTWVLPIIELSILVYIFLKIRKTRTHFKTHSISQTDFFTALKTTTKEVLPKTLAAVFTMEIAVFYYGFFNWKKPELKENEFSYHRIGNTITLVSAFFMVILVEAITIHIIVSKWSVTASWIFTGVSIYSAIQIFGLLKSVIKRPVIIENNSIHLRYGIINEAYININDIENINWSPKSIDLDKSIKALSPLEKMEGHNVIIHLKKESFLKGLYGSKITFKSIAFTVDNKKEFKKKIEEKLY